MVRERWTGEGEEEGREWRWCCWGDDVQRGGDREAVGERAGWQGGGGDSGTGEGVADVGGGHVPLQRGSGGDVGRGGPACVPLRVEQLLLRNRAGPDLFLPSPLSFLFFLYL